MMDVPKKEVLLDSSSAILLEKTELLEALLSAYRVVVCGDVYRELTENTYPSADLFKSLYRDSALFLSEIETCMQRETVNERALSSLNAGERETIRQYLSGVGDFIMLDDGKAARFCSNHRLPFINALLFPSILYFSKRISPTGREQKVRELIEIGHYSRKIVKIASEFSREALGPFLP